MTSHVKGVPARKACIMHIKLLHDWGQSVGPTRSRSCSDKQCRWYRWLLTGLRKCRWEVSAGCCPTLADGAPAGSGIKPLVHTCISMEHRHGYTEQRRQHLDCDGMKLQGVMHTSSVLSLSPLTVSSQPRPASFCTATPVSASRVERLVVHIANTATA